MSDEKGLALLDAFEAACAGDIARNADLARGFRELRRLHRERDMLEAEAAALKRDGKIGRA